MSPKTLHSRSYSRRLPPVNNDAGLSDAGQAVTTGQDPRVFAVGIRHTF